jgi:hypothetical protein
MPRDEAALITAIACQKRARPGCMIDAALWKRIWIFLGVAPLRRLWWFPPPQPVWFRASYPSFSAFAPEPIVVKASRTKYHDAKQVCAPRYKCRAMKPR